MVPEKADEHGVDAVLINTQALEHADRNDQHQWASGGDQSRQPVRPVGCKKKNRKDLEPQAQDGPRQSLKI